MGGHISDSTREANETALETLDEQIGRHCDTEEQKYVESFRILFGLAKSLNLDSSGRTNIKPVMRDARRRAVKALFRGDNYDEIAKLLRIPVQIVRDDMTYADEHREK